MYKISVPIALNTIDRSDRSELVAQLRGLDASRVFLALGNYTLDPDKRRSDMEKLKKETAYFKSLGFEVGAWIWSFMLTEPNDFVLQCGLDGVPFPDAYCPSDDSFVEFVGGYVSDIAGAGVDLIMFDDDYRFGEFKYTTEGCSVGCACKNHRAYMEKLIGKPLPDPAELSKLVMSGGKNEYRSALMRANAHYLKRFAHAARAAVDSVDPSVRLGVCACISVWDQDGVSADEISRILAGGTKPFLRLIGAPYWAARNSSLGKRLQYVIELERAERSWVTDPDEIEIFSEGDVYDRPRYACPASYLEAFDTALRADGKLNGILKYGIDYVSSAACENGYAERHIAHRPAYRAIDGMFSGKTGAGVRIYCNKNIFENAVIPEKVSGTSAAQYIFFPVESRLLSTLSIPTVYEGKGVCGAAFGEHARYLESAAFENGLILDAAAAKILTEKGVDVGLSEYGGTFKAGSEHYPAYNDYALSLGEAVELTLKSGAEVVSVYANGAPAAYRYQNADGQRFFVLCFEAAFNDDRIWRHYLKARQLADAVSWLSGRKLPAHIVGAPDLYMLAKEGQGSLAVGLWNLFADDVMHPVVTLNKKYSRVRFYGCDGALDSDKLTLSRIEPYGFCFFEVSD